MPDGPRCSCECPCESDDGQCWCLENECECTEYEDWPLDAAPDAEEPFADVP